MSIERDDRIGPTAHYTAYVWDRLHFPYAHLFTTRAGAGLFWGFRLGGEWVALLLPRVPSMPQYLELRHRLIEASLAELRPDRVVEIGAGLSRRGVTWAADHGVRYTEMDLPAMSAAKRECIDERAPDSLKRRLDGKLELVAHDVLAATFSDALVEQLRGAERAVVIAEGLLGYFALPERLEVLRSVVRALRRVGGGSLICDLRSDEGGRTIAVAASILYGAIRIATKGRGARENFRNSTHIREFFAEAGFDSVSEVPRSLAPQLARLENPARVWRGEVSLRKTP